MKWIVTLNGKVEAAFDTREEAGRFAEGIEKGRVRVIEVEEKTK